MFFPSVLFKVDIVERKFLAKVLVSCKKKRHREGAGNIMPEIRHSPETGKNLQNCEKIKNAYKYFSKHA